MGTYSGQPLIKDWYIYTFWTTFRDYWLNTKMSVARWATERNADVGKFFTKNLLMKKLK